LIWGVVRGETNSKKNSPKTKDKQNAEVQQKTAGHLKVTTMCRGEEKM